VAIPRSYTRRVVAGDILARLCDCGLMEDDGAQYTSTSDLIEQIRAAEGN
jgi:hypothetical protein